MTRTHVNADNAHHIQYTEQTAHQESNKAPFESAPGLDQQPAADMMESAANPTNVARMLAGYSIEVNPNDPKVVDAALARLAPGTEVFLTWIPGANPMDAVDTAARLRRAGLRPVPHIGARHIETADQLQRLSLRLAGEAGVDRVLIIGGDRAAPAGPYDSSLAVMRSEAFQKAGIFRIAVAGFPEGNPNISESISDEAFDAKVNFARSAGLELCIVTQFCFESEPIVEWLRRIRARGIDVPIRVGLAGPAGLTALARYAVRCGIGNSLRVLTEKPSFAKLLVDKGPEPIIRGIAGAAHSSNGSLPFGIAGLHFFVFGGFNRTVDWINGERNR